MSFEKSFDVKGQPDQFISAGSVDWHADVHQEPRSRDSEKVTFESVANKQARLEETKPLATEHREHIERQTEELKQARSSTGALDWTTGFSGKLDELIGLNERYTKDLGQHGQTTDEALKQSKQKLEEAKRLDEKAHELQAAGNIEEARRAREESRQALHLADRAVDGRSYVERRDLDQQVDNQTSIVAGMQGINDSVHTAATVAEGVRDFSIAAVPIIASGPLGITGGGMLGAGYAAATNFTRGTVEYATGQKDLNTAGQDAVWRTVDDTKTSIVTAIGAGLAGRVAAGALEAGISKVGAGALAAGSSGVVTAGESIVEKYRNAAKAFEAKYGSLEPAEKAKKWDEYKEKNGLGVKEASSGLLVDLISATVSGGIGSSAAEKGGLSGAVRAVGTALVGIAGGYTKAVAAGREYTMQDAVNQTLAEAESALIGALPHAVESRGERQFILPEPGTTRFRISQVPSRALQKRLLEEMDQSSLTVERVLALPPDLIEKHITSRVEGGDRNLSRAVLEAEKELIQREEDRRTGGREPLTPEDVLTPEQNEQYRKMRAEQHKHEEQGMIILDKPQIEARAEAYMCGKGAARETLPPGGTVRQEKILHIVLGPPAAGKSKSIVNELQGQFGARLIDSDRVKPDLPGYAGGLGNERVHEASDEVVTTVRRKAFEQGDNVVQPIIGRSPNSVYKIIEEARAHGYKIAIHLADVPPEESARRMYNRGFSKPPVDGGDQQMVPLEYSLNDVGFKPAIVFEHLVKTPGLVDAWSAYDTSGFSPRLTGKSENQLQSHSGVSPPSGSPQLATQG